MGKWENEKNGKENGNMKKGKGKCTTEMERKKGLVFGISNRYSVISNCLLVIENWLVVSGKR